jgi:hypothetical protein
MDKVIGIGPDGCRLAEQFMEYPQYDVYRIDVGLEGEDCYSLQKRESPEDYEKYVPDLKTFFKGISGDILVVVGGGSPVTGACLRIMQQLEGCNLHVLYKRPVLTELNRTALLQERLVYNVFQEYARSGVFKKLFLVSESSVEELVGDVPILQFKNAIDKQIVNVFHYVNVFNHTEPVVDNTEPAREIARICTLGIQDLKSGEEKDLFQLENVCDKTYYYAIKEDDLKTDTRLIKTIREQLAKNEIRPSYCIHSTKYPESFCFYVSHSSRIQST